MQHTHSKTMLHTVAGLATSSRSSITWYVRRVKHNNRTMLLLLPPLPDPPDPRQFPNLLTNTLLGCPAQLIAGVILSTVYTV